MADNLLPPRKGHPRALYVLFFTEMWERFGFYLMLGIFFLYLIDPLLHGGKGFDNTTAADIVGSYFALVYLTPFIGGLIADRYIGYRRAIIIGGSLMALGYFGLAVPGTLAMFISLAFIIVGNGFFKPNISTLLGNIYSTEELKPKKDMAYNIFYMGINIGAFFCNFVAAYLRNTYGWGYAFAAAGVGMTIGLIWFLNGMKHIKSGDIIKPVQKEDMSLNKLFGYVFLPAILAGILGWNMYHIVGHSITGEKSDDAFFFALVPVIIFYLGIYLRAAKEDKRGLGALFAFFLVTTVFWVVYNQNGTALTIWAKQYTDRYIPEAGVKWTKPFGMLQTISSDTITVDKMDNHFVDQLDANGNTIEVRGVDPYLQNLPHAQWPAPHQKMNFVSPEIFQSVNPIFIVILTPIVLGIFGWLRTRNTEPPTPTKIGIGMVVAGLAMFTMVFAVKSTDIYLNKTNMIWLISEYGIFTVGELLISPMGLSLTSKLSPPWLTALMMGAWFIIVSIGGKVSGLMASYWDKFTDKSQYFMILFIASLISAVILFMMVKWLSSVVREKTGSN